MLAVNGYESKREKDIFTYDFTYTSDNGKRSHIKTPIIKLNVGGKKPHISFWPISKLTAVEALNFSKALSDAAHTLDMYTGFKFTRISMCDKGD